MRGYLHCYFLALLLAVTPAVASTYNDALIARYGQQNTITALAGTKEVVAVHQESSIPLERGLAVIIAEPGYQGLTLKAGEALARRMNQWGWQTLLVINPAQTTIPVARSAPVKSYTDTTSDWLNADNHESELAIMLSALLQQVKAQAGYRMIISQGMTAAHLIKLNALSKIPEPDSLVVVAPFWPEHAINNQLAGLVKQTPSPLLDITGAVPNRWSEYTQRKRREQANTALKLHYRQRNMQPDIGGQAGAAPAFAAQLSKQIYGWTRYLGW